MDKKIFKANIEGTDLFFDPFEVDYHYAEACKGVDIDQINNWLKIPKTPEGEPDWDKIDKDPILQSNYAEAVHRLVPLIRKAFELEDYDKTTGNGLTSNQVLSLWGDYVDWQFDIKKNTESQPTTVPPTDSQESSSQQRTTTTS
jgi:hypothetical protein